MIVLLKGIPKRIPTLRFLSLAADTTWHTEASDYNLKEVLAVTLLAFRDLHNVELMFIWMAAVLVESLFALPTLENLEIGGRYEEDSRLSYHLPTVVSGFPKLRSLAATFAFDGSSSAFLSSLGSLSSLKISLDSGTWSTSSEFDSIV
ncbi:hypothetical protein FRB94_011069 [Tulasnella sp. JGI-2019a]|nr:hypothetical protein FRB93_006068 [Tulasnella sp. JGI-2019a]KAG8993059.1 hypothetical protein FRB94_011069 [Tulasnella sp. JGI-2019a]KAG9025252.1 hypothetical protein FRB95_010372 [Tulasnella sp. JGI-2019a]